MMNFLSCHNPRREITDRKTDNFTGNNYPVFPGVKLASYLT